MDVGLNWNIHIISFVILYFYFSTFARMVIKLPTVLSTSRGPYYEYQILPSICSGSIMKVLDPTKKMKCKWTSVTQICSGICVCFMNLVVQVDSRDLQTSNISIWRYHCLRELAFLKIWNQYWLPSDTVHQRFCSSPLPIFKLSLQVPWTDFGRDCEILQIGHWKSE